MQPPPFTRALDLARFTSSAFLFGPRMCGKTWLLRQFETPHYLDLLDTQTELAYREAPQKFGQELRAIPKGALVIVDEVQRVPALLDYVQMGIDQLGQRFLLSGSSARKLKRGGANLLGGRALDLRLHSLSVAEIGAPFDLDLALSYGTLPRIYTLLLNQQVEEVRLLLGSYYSTYLKEEVQAEALTRNIPSFQRFLRIAAQSNGQIIEYANIGRACQVRDYVVREYYQILEDTLMGCFLYPWDASERRKSRPKFYFFDTGVVRAIQNRLFDPPTGQELGLLFETWFVHELTALRDYHKPYLELSFWRDRDDEVDLLLSRGGKHLLAVELKSGVEEDLRPSTVRKFAARFPKVDLIVVSRRAQRPRRLPSGHDLLPWRQALRRIQEHL